MKRLGLTLLTVFGLPFSSFAGGGEAPGRVWAKVQATNQFQRSLIANTGVVIEHVGDDFVAITGIPSEIKAVEKKFKVDSKFTLTEKMIDFPGRDARFHNFNEMLQALRSMATNNPDIVRIQEFGRSAEGHPLLNIKITTNAQERTDNKPGIIFMGGHHAREHVSVEFPIMLAQWIVAQYRQGSEDVQRMLQSREINIIPLVNPDGSEYDIADGRYKSWRKNRRPLGGRSIGVDLNRNYSYKWGTSGASRNPASDTYMGPTPFSEPETQAVKRFVEAKDNSTILVSFHTFSELILYPWSYADVRIANERDYLAHKKMAEDMAAMNGYRAIQSASLYPSSGDTSDWAYAEQNMFSFTFELDPRSQAQGGFYPGQGILDVVFRKNLRPCIYMIGLADNPYRSLQTNAGRFGLRSSSLLQ